MSVNAEAPLMRYTVEVRAVLDKEDYLPVLVSKQVMVTDLTREWSGPLFDECFEEVRAACAKLVANGWTQRRRP